MRRNTLTPARGRLSLAHPAQAVPEKRNVRSPSYQEQCITNVLSFLDEHNYENTSQKGVRSPTLKEFQNLFKFTISFFYKNWECKRFEDDAMQLIKQLKYPYINEINKSHLVTTSPHSWPVVLSFISWLIDMIRFVGVCEAEEDDVFVRCCFDGYLRFMEGIDNHFEDTLSEQFRKKHETKIREYESRMDRKKELENRLNEWEMKGENAALKRKIEELEDDKKSIMEGFKQLEMKKDKYCKMTQRYKEEIGELGSGMGALQDERNRLKENIGKQKINVDSYKEMNARKNELLKQLERIKPEKEKCFVMLSEKRRSWARLERRLRSTCTILDV
ncbi:Centromere-associated protein HEC1 [Trachipleistophora hominis]|uniref:Kinetochore protein NDC80 n=1 Tax=Trachipleistophora hominis TaxID=72359 RepID=L7JVA9_TRAHO|nr:Centromere-associated protein HEC1 [Trachipleistophora hominis]